MGKVCRDLSRPVGLIIAANKWHMVWGSYTCQWAEFGDYNIVFESQSKESQRTNTLEDTQWIYHPQIEWLGNPLDKRPPRRFTGGDNTAITGLNFSNDTSQVKILIHLL